jgi:long-subunit acyl-CoA synthetase (AMP-forming)
VEEYLRASPAIEECVILLPESHRPERSRLVAVVSPATDPPDTNAITARITAANAAAAPEERIGGLVIAPEPFSIGNGMLTSQFKPRRRRIAEAYLNHWKAVGS